MADEVSGIIGLLRFLGLTPETLVPLFILALFLYIIFHKKLHGHLNPIKHAIVEIQSIMSNARATISHSLTERGQSPLTPTDYGLTLINESGLANILNENKDKFLEELRKILEKSKQVTPYDIQEKARDFLIQKKDEIIMVEVKNYAFKNALSDR